MAPTPEESDCESETGYTYEFPKVELHCHLDGCFRIPTVIDVARKRGIHLPSYDEKELAKYITVSERCDSLAEYLGRFRIFEPVFAGDAEAIARMTREAVEDKANDSIKYIELRYSPLLLANCDVEPVVYAKERGRLRPKDVVEVVNKAAADAAEEFSIKVGTILCDISNEKWGAQTAELCREYHRNGVVGFDVAGSEGSESGEFSPDCVQAFQYCKMNGIHRTAHAGEDGPASQVKMAIEQLHAERIGHGYHVVDDEDIYNMALRLRTHLEVCPLSSHLTSSVPADLKQHPARRFLADNMNFSLSTDDPGLQQTTLLDDYNISVNEWGFSIKDLQMLNLNAARSCFLDDSEKEQLISDLKKAYAEYNSQNVGFETVNYVFDG